MHLLRTPEAKVLLVLAFVLAALELGARVFEERLSKDVKHIRSLPLVAATVKNTPAEKLSVLIIGNSLSRDGLDQTLLKEGLARITGREVSLAAMYPDASSIAQWYYGYRRYFDQTGSPPDLILLGTGRPHLLDSTSAPDRLAAFYTSLSDMPHLLARQSGDVEAISKALFARTSMLFAHRGRVQPLVFYNLVPGFTETTQTLSIRRDPIPAPATSAESATPPARSETCTTFAEFLATLHAAHTRALIVTIPMTEPYTLPACVQEAAEAQKVPVLTTGARMKLDPARFPDSYHLDDQGAAQFTRALLEEIATVLPKE